jgi:hypothetical protein
MKEDLENTCMGEEGFFAWSLPVDRGTQAGKFPQPRRALFADAWPSPTPFGPQDDACWMKVTYDQACGARLQTSPAMAR